MRLQIDAERQTILLAALDAYTQVLGASKKAREKATLNTEDEDDRLHIINGQPDGLKWQLGYREEKPEKPKDPAQQDAFEGGAETGGAPREKVGADFPLVVGSMITWPSGERTRVAEIIERMPGEDDAYCTAYRVRDEGGADVWVALIDGAWMVQGQAVEAQRALVAGMVQGVDPGAGDDRGVVDYEVTDDYSAGANPRTAYELLQALSIDVPLDVVEGWSRDDRAAAERWAIAERKLRLNLQTDELTPQGRAMAPTVLAIIFGEGDDTDDTRTLGMDERLHGEQGELSESDDELTPSAETLADLQ